MALHGIPLKIHSVGDIHRHRLTKTNSTSPKPLSFVKNSRCKTMA